MENWTWGLSLIALTMAIHATGIALMAFATVRIRVRMESLNRLSLHHVFAIMIGLIGVVGLLLAGLHGIEAAVWATAYWWLGALDSPGEAILYSVDSMSTRFCRLDEHSRRFRTSARASLADDGRTRGGGRYAPVRDQHGLYLHGNASLLGANDPPSPRTE